MWQGMGVKGADRLSRRVLELIASDAPGFFRGIELPALSGFVLSLSRLPPKSVREEVLVGE